MKRLLLPIILLFLLVGIAACDSNVIYRHHLLIPNSIWGRENGLLFFMPIEKPIARATFELTIRHTTRIPYRKTRFIIRIESPSGAIRTDTCVASIRDKEGKLLGRGLGDLWDLDIPILEGYVIDQVGMYEIEIQQAMSRNQLASIQDVGVVVKDD